MPYQVITTSRDTLATKRDLLLHVVRAMTRAMKFAHEDKEGARKLVRPFFEGTSDADFNTAFDSYIKAVPTTPVISQAQVDNTVKMVNLAEKAPITRRTTRWCNRPGARGREGHSGQVAYRRRRRVRPHRALADRRRACCCWRLGTSGGRPVGNGSAGRA